MIFSQTKIYRTKHKSEPIFFLSDDEKKIILVLSHVEFTNPIFTENLKKTTQALGFDFEKEVVVTSVPENGSFNWSGLLLQNRPMYICFFGNHLSGIPDLSTNTSVKLSHHTLFQTFTMNEIVTEQYKKGEFWINFKSLFSA